MRRFTICCAALALLPVSAMAGASSPAPAKSGPPVIPYVCADGSLASVVYENGGDYLHARALVTHQDRTVELDAAPTLYGTRYRGAGAEGAALAWTLRGEEAWLSESPDADGYARQESELIRCVRQRRLDAGELAHGDPH